MMAGAFGFGSGAPPASGMDPAAMKSKMAAAKAAPPRMAKAPPPAAGGVRTPPASGMKPPAPVRGGTVPMAGNTGARPLQPAMGGVKPQAAPSPQAQQMQAKMQAAKAGAGPMIQSNSPFAGAKMFAKGGKVMATGDRGKYAK